MAVQQGPLQERAHALQLARERLHSRSSAGEYASPSKQAAERQAAALTAACRRCWLTSRHDLASSTRGQDLLAPGLIGCER